MGSCEERPSVTLWGTTQVTTLTTVLSTITRADAPRTTSSVTATTCDGDGNCGPVARPTIIVDDADLSFVTVTRETVVTNIVPVQTRYHPCPGASSSIGPSAEDSSVAEPEPESTLTNTSPEPTTTERQVDSLTLTNTVPAPTTSSNDNDDLPATTSRTSITRDGDTTRLPISGDTTTSAMMTEDDPSVLPYTSDQTGFVTVSPENTDQPLPTGSTGLDASNSSSSSSSNGIGSSEIAGIVIGSLAGLIFLGLFILRCRNRRDRKEGGLVHEETYWERRFQELEGGVEKAASSPGAGVNEPPEEEGTHQLHMSLNLGSQHPTINRPASRLSAISSFFGGGGGGGGRDSPGPFRLAAMRTSNRQPIDFSQPRTDDDEVKDRSSLRSYARTASVKSTSTRSQAGSSSRLTSDRRGSAWPFNAITAVIASSIKGGGSDDGSSAHHVNSRGMTTRQTEARKGMEWIRTIVSSDSGFGFNNHYYQGQTDTSSPSNGNGRGLPPPPRSRGVSPLPSLASDTSSPVSGPAAPSGTGMNKIRQSAFPELHPDPDTSSPAPPVYEPRSQSPSHDQDLPLVGGGGGVLAGSRQLYPSSSLRKKRQHKGLAVPDLELNQDAISPSLWIDDETLDRFGRSQVSPTNSRSVPVTTLPEPIPPVPAVPQVSNSNVQPLNISKRTIFPTSIPSMPRHAKSTGQIPQLPRAPVGGGPTGPSAFNAPELISRFSPDSSRASFSTLQDHARRRGSETSMKELPQVPVPPTSVAPPVPAPVPSGIHSNSTPRIGADQDQARAKRFERSAVTPQLPTLATSNADAFRAEMVEWSASTGGSDRMERVISFHGNRD